MSLPFQNHYPPIAKPLGASHRPKLGPLVDGNGLVGGVFNGSALLGAALAIVLLPLLVTTSSRADETVEETAVAPTASDADSDLNSSGKIVKRINQKDQALAELTASWDFQRSSDTNFDRWPDGWQRYLGRNFPRYINIEIAARNTELEESSLKAGQSIGKLWLAWQRGKIPNGLKLETLPPEVDKLLDTTVNRCLEMRLNGGSIDISTPLMAIEPRFYYSLQFDLQTVELSDHKVSAQIEILDGKKNLLSVHPTATRSGNNAWQRIEIDALHDRPQPAARFGRVRFMVQGPTSSAAGGIVRIDRIRVWKVPRIRLTLDRPINTFNEGEPVHVRVIATGLSEQDRRVDFQLFDHHGEVIEKAQRKFEKPKERELLISTDFSGVELSDDEHLQVDGEAVWEPSVREPGFYTLRAELGRADNQPIYRSLSFAILNGDVSTGKGRFGWSFNTESLPHVVNHIPILAQQAALGWIKIPVWYDPHDLRRSDEISWLLDRLQNLGMRCIGVFDQPPTHLKSQFSSTDTTNAATLFQDPQVWQPQLEPILTRTSLNIMLYQLGSDDDFSFQGYSNLSERIDLIRKHFQTYGQDINIGLPWSWLDFDPETFQNSCDFVTLQAIPSLTSAELGSYIKLLENNSHLRWISIAPLDARYYPAEQRVQDLVERMIQASKNRIEAAFIPNPMDPNTGIMQSDGSPSLLFLPWRTIAFHLTGATYIGTFSLPGGSTNFVFERNGEAILIGWNNHRTIEQIYLGDDVQIADLWGNTSQAEAVTDASFQEQRIEFGPEPIIVTGLSLPIAKYRISFMLANNENNTPGATKVKLSATFANGFDQPAVGLLELYSPDLLANTSVKRNFDLKNLENAELGLELLLRPDASSGTQNITAIFDIYSEKKYRFRVFHPLYIGAKDIEVELSYELDKDGNLVIRQDLVNNTSKVVDFECTLYVPERVHQRQQLLQVAPGRMTRYYRLERGTELKGKVLWLKCKQLNSNQYLNYRATMNW
jgi:hypothetical protein